MAVTLTEEQKLVFLKDEYLFLQNQYEDFDRRSLTIKSWVASGSVAVLALSFNTPSRYALFLPLMVGSICIVFWYLEVYWKLFQYALRDRIRIIEAYFRNDLDILTKNPPPFQIYHSWFQSYVKEFSDLSL